MTQCIFFALQSTKTLRLSNISPLFVKEVNSQFSVMIRFGKLMSSETMICLYKAFILPHLYYCSTSTIALWCSTSPVNKILINWTF